MPTYIGNSQTFASIPSLLISDLQRVSDPIVRRALLQVQDFCNSVGSVQGELGTGTAGLGTQCPAIFAGNPTTWTRVSYKGAAAWIPVWV